MPRRTQLNTRAMRIQCQRNGCICGCGEPVSGEAIYSSPACRKRVQRLRARLEQYGPIESHVSNLHEPDSDTEINSCD